MTRLTRMLAGTWLALTLAVSAFAGTANAVPVPMRISDLPSYSGPGRVHANPCLTYFNKCFTSTANEAWRWSHGSWSKSFRAVGTHVWVAPFGAGWSWTYASPTGWLAMRSDWLFTRSDPCRSPMRVPGCFRIVPL